MEMKALEEAFQLAGVVLLIGLATALIVGTAHANESVSPCQWETTGGAQQVSCR